MSASQSSAAVWSAVASVTKLGDCWFVSALAALASRDDGAYLRRVLLTPEIE
jgi:hypothetical protein